MAKDKSYLTVFISSEVVTKIKIEAIQKNKPLKDLVEEILKEYLENKGDA